MARKAAKKAAKKASTVTVVYHVAHTKRGMGATTEQREADMGRIHAHISKRGGRCELHRGEDGNEFISIVSGLTKRSHNGLVKAMEQGGHVTARQFTIMKGGP